MVIYFKLEEAIDGRKMVEVWDNGVFIAGIYPHENHIAIVSKYLDEAFTDSGYPPTLMIMFKRHTD